MDKDDPRQYKTYHFQVGIIHLTPNAYNSTAAFMTLFRPIHLSIRSALEIVNLATPAHHCPLVLKPSRFADTGEKRLVAAAYYGFKQDYHGQRVSCSSYRDAVTSSFTYLQQQSFYRGRQLVVRQAREPPPKPATPVQSKDCELNVSHGHTGSGFPLCFLHAYIVFGIEVSMAVHL
jgi:hypothetical protein